MSAQKSQRLRCRFHICFETQCLQIWGNRVYAKFFGVYAVHLFIKVWHSTTRIWA
ncbi:9460_t:CDS:2, partial [Gigaspora rosea]